jgi:hypothetical protein
MQAKRCASYSSSSSSSSESEDDVPLSKLKRPPRKRIEESSDEEDNIPLSKLDKEPTKSHLQSQSTHDEDMEKEEEEEGDASDLEEPLGGVVEDDVLPPSLNLVWDGGKIVKCLDPSSGARIWRCHHCKNKWSGWNHTKALGHAIGGGKDIRGCKNVPPEWRKLYMGIVKRKSLAAAEKTRHHERLSISIDEKEQDAKEHYQREKESIRARRYKGAIPTESVDVSGSPAGDLSTLTSLKPLSLKPSSIFSSGKIFYVLYVPLSCWSYETHFPLCPLL